MSRFTAYDLAEHCCASPGARPVAQRAAWLTGQSAYRHSQLSPGQHGLLDALDAVGFTPLRAGFPYNRAALAASYRPEPIVVASRRNAAQFLAARFSRTFRDEIARHLQPVVDRTSRRLLLLCGSCGLEFLTAAWPLLVLPAELEIVAMVLGGFGRVPAPGSQLRVYAVRGKNDLVSRLGCRLAPDERVPGGHLDYAASPEVRAAVLRFARVLAGPREGG
ncbi:MAG: hypothetical protein HKP61_15260 [Dactylosporangium sp.]|nr:hypothetical protein [Dactylosporangium sp.]NNJ62268.1 hypothetical protein [Dactylosporangium sp.]